MITLQTFDPLAVRAGLHALLIVSAKTPKGRKNLEKAIALLQEHAMAAQITPICSVRKLTPRQRETMTEGALYLEAIRDLIDEGRV